VPVGAVFADADKQRAEKKGSMDGPDVVPEHRRKGIGTALCGRALSSLRQRGMETVLTFTRDTPASTSFAESLGSSRVRAFSLMRRSLADIPHGIGESHEVRLEFLGRTDADLALLTNLDNEAFKEHFNHQDKTAEETKFVLGASADGGDKDYILTGAQNRCQCMAA
jgi:hypothetical protein